MAGQAALRSGAGLVTVATPASALPLVAMTMAAQDVDLDADPDIDPANKPNPPVGETAPG